VASATAIHEPESDLPPERLMTTSPPPSRRPRWLLAGLAAGAILGTGVAVGVLVDTGGGRDHPAARATATATAASSPEPATPAAASFGGPTCEQFEQSFTGGYDLGMTANEWAGQLLADLGGAGSNALIRLTFTMDLKSACLDPSRFGLSARLVGTAVYQVDPTKYASR
jgi:hypothetical protein